MSIDYNFRQCTEAAVLTLDLETIPSQNPAVKAAIYARDAFRQVTEIGPIEPDSRFTDPEKIAKSIAERTKAAERNLTVTSDLSLASAACITAVNWLNKALAAANAAAPKA
jgi:hypothetical protein